MADSEKTLGIRKKLEEHEAKRPMDWSGGTYGQMVGDALDRILNREPFSYNLSADPLYQQYKDQYVRGGKMAMQDTIGQAAQLTGGYGNSYAATAGNQAYQGYLTGLNDRVPDLYSLALSKFTADGDAMRDNFSVLQGMQDREYEQHQSSVSRYLDERDRLDNLLLKSEQMDYQSARDAIADAQWQAEFDEAVRQWNQLHPTSKSGRGGGGGGGGGGSGLHPSLNPDDLKDDLGEWAQRLYDGLENTIEHNGEGFAQRMVIAKAADGSINEHEYDWINKQMGWA